MSSQQIFRYYINLITSLPWGPTTKPSKEATLAWSQNPNIQCTIYHLHPTEQSRIIQFYNPSDASRCLGSILLKHLAIMRGCSIPWSESIITQERDIRNGKPFYEPGGIDFNVSHHGSYVVCIGSTAPEAKVGIDIVQIDVEKDSKRMRSGFEGWVDNFVDVLSEREKRDVVGLGRAEGVGKGLRLFYTIWACKEAYIKMTADALMATYLKELSFPGLSVPEGGEGWGMPVVTGVVVKGRSIEGVRIEIVALGRDYIVATAVSQQGELPPFEIVKISDDGAVLECSVDGANDVSKQTYSLEA